MVRRRTNLEHFVAESSGHAVWVGVDVHKRTYAVALLREDGELAAYTTTSDNETLLRQLREWKLAVLCLAYESGPTGFGLARCCGRAGIPVIVAAPSRILRPVSPAAKTDSLDCRKLAELASRRMLRRIVVPTEEEEALRALERRRHQLADGQRKARQRIKSFLLFHGIPEPAGLESWTSASLEALKGLSLLPALRDTLDSHLEELRFVRDRLLALTSKLAGYTTELHKARLACLKSVPGVGDVTACSFLSELFRPERFERGEEVAAYLGLAPFVRQSGEKRGTGRLRSTGHSRLRSLLVEAAWVWKCKEPCIQGYYARLLARSGLAQKAITAVARKLALVLWRLACEVRPYRPAPL